MQPSDLQILYEDNHLLAVNKPAGLPTMGVKADAPSVFLLAKGYLKERYAKPGNVYLGVVSRLDAWVSGVVLVARTSKAASRLAEQFRRHQVTKIYWAVVDARVEPPSGHWTDWIAKDEQQHRMVVARAEAPGSKQAELSYRRLRILNGLSLLEINLETGRKHQIRVQLAARGLPILGDRKYGSRTPFPAGIALHARRLVVRHPTRGTNLEIVAPPPPTWRIFEALE